MTRWAWIISEHEYYTAIRVDVVCNRIVNIPKKKQRNVNKFKFK